MEDGCQVAVNENGTVERNNDIINCTCDHLGIYGVRVVSYKRFEEWQKRIRLLCVEMCLYHTAEHKSCDVYRSLLCARQHQNTLPAYVLEYWVLVCALCERTASLPPSPFLPPPRPAISPSLFIAPIQNGYIFGSAVAYTGSGVALGSGMDITASYIGTTNREFGLSCNSSGPFDSYGRDCSGTVMWVDSLSKPGKMISWSHWRHDLLHSFPSLFLSLINITLPISPL